MKYFTLIMIAGALMTAPSTSAKKFTGSLPALKSISVKGETSDRAKKTEAILKAAQSAELKPSKQEVYYSENGEWILDMTIGLTYDTSGRIQSYTEDVVGEPGIKRTDYTYDNYGNCIKEISYVSTDGGKNWTAQEKREREFTDPILHNLMTSNEGYGAQGNDWWMQFGNKFDVIRNGDGNITNYNVKVYFQGDYDTTIKTTLNYPEGKKEPDSWTVSSLRQDFSWSDGMKLDNITWESCNGQIAITDYSKLFLGDNKIKSAKMYDEGEFFADLTVDYPKGDDFIAVASYSENGETGREIHSITQTDDYGSYIEEIIAEYTYDDDPEAVEREGEIHEVKYDEHGNEISETAIFVEGDLRETEGIITFEHKYGDNGELLETVTSQMDYDTKEMVDVEKIISSDFVEITLGTDNVISSKSTSCTIDGETLTVAANGEVTVKVYSVTGLLMLSADGNGALTVNLSTLPEGVYVAIASGANDSTTFKFAK